MSAVTMTRKIIEIDEEKCDGCGLCVPNCAEGAIQIIEGKARLVSDVYCDGLGACLGHCPQEAIKIIEREAEVFDEKAVRLHLKNLGRDVEEHVHKHHAASPEPVQAARAGVCPGSRMIDFRDKPAVADSKTGSVESQLRQWPVKLSLVSPMAAYFEKAHLLLAADCAAFASGGFHRELLKGRTLVIGCPKFDDLDAYIQKLTSIVEMNDIQSITVAHMEVPCCFSLAHAAKHAVQASGKDVPVNITVVTVDGRLEQA